MKPNVLVLQTDGTNCDEELAFAFHLAGGNAKLIHINELRKRKNLLQTFQILAIPGGFSYGDDIVSGKILATELTSYFADTLQTFINRPDTLTLGICNGFQALVRTGLLPFAHLGKMEATLTNNDSGHFDCRWIKLKTEQNTKCVFLKNIARHSGEDPAAAGDNSRISKRSWTSQDDDVLSFTIAHGEGKFFTDSKTLEEIEKNHLVAFRYVDEKGNPTQKYPENPNGSLHAIAGITDPSGRILGLMPHPERFVKKEQHPNWRRKNISKPHGLPIFENMITFAKNS